MNITPDTKNHLIKSGHSNTEVCRFCQLNSYANTNGQVCVYVLMDITEQIQKLMMHLVQVSDAPECVSDTRNDMTLCVY